MRLDYLVLIIMGAFTGWFIRLIWVTDREARAYEKQMQDEFDEIEKKLRSKE